MNTFGRPENIRKTLQIEKEKNDQELEELKASIKKAIDIGPKFNSDVDTAGEDAYLISEHLREGCTSCPFCYDRDLNFGMVDETHTGVLKQQITCLGCGESWAVEYEASRVSYKGKWYSRFEYWPTYIQAEGIKYRERLMAKYGINIWRPGVEEAEEEAIPVKRKNAIKLLIDYAKSFDW